MKRDRCHRHCSVDVLVRNVGQCCKQHLLLLRPSRVASEWRGPIGAPGNCYATLRSYDEMSPPMCRCTVASPSLSEFASSTAAPTGGKWSRTMLERMQW